jgi:hypothetical protein
MVMSVRSKIKFLGVGMMFIGLFSVFGLALTVWNRLALLSQAHAVKLVAVALVVLLVGALALTACEHLFSADAERTEP